MGTATTSSMALLFFIFILSHFFACLLFSLVCFCSSISRDPIFIYIYFFGCHFSTTQSLFNAIIMSVRCRCQPIDLFLRLLSSQHQDLLLWMAICSTLWLHSSCIVIVCLMLLGNDKAISFAYHIFLFIASNFLFGWSIHSPICIRCETMLKLLFIG